MGKPSTQRDRALWERLIVAQEDLRQAEAYASFIRKHGWHLDASTRRRVAYLQQSAFTTALVVSYGRVFVQARGWPSVPARLFSRTEEQMALHARLLDLRDEIYAHSDVRRHGPQKVELFGETFVHKNQVSLKLDAADLNVVIGLIQNARKSIRRRIAEL